MTNPNNEELFIQAIMNLIPIRNKEWKEMIEMYSERKYDIVKLWDNGTPNFNEEYGQDEPMLILYPAHKGNPTGSFILSVGGGFHFKTRSEAVPVADYFYDKGYHVAVLDYRVLPYTRWDSAADLLRAIQYIRCYSEKYNIDPNHVVAGGFSAGGIISNMAGSIYSEGNINSDDKLERYSNRPNAVMVGYGSFSDILNVNTGLAFDFARQRELARTSPDLLLHPDCPPRFLFQTVTDDPRNISNMQMRLAENGIPFEAHFFQAGSHGDGMFDGQYGTENLPHVAHWAELFDEWLSLQGFPTSKQ